MNSIAIYPKLHRVCGLTTLMLVITASVYADDPSAGASIELHSMIDARLKPIAGAEIPPCSDAEFHRRASLDLIGMPPTVQQAREFIEDASADKRERLIDRLIASPHHVRHIAATLDLMLMERRKHTHVDAEQWKAWLMTAVKENRPWNLLVRQMLLSDGSDPATRPAARFLLDRESEPHLLTRDIGRILFGRDLQCAQCHDHPTISSYLQSDYQGLLAFVSAAYPQVIKEKDKETTVVGEKAPIDLTFESVFEGIPRRTGARMPDEVQIEEPDLLPGEEYAVAPAENTKPVPKFSRRTKLAELATSGSNRAFNENIVNRLWAHMFGRGLVHPLDLHHADNPAMDPELLRILSEQFVEMNFDIQAFLRELALTEAYSRSFDSPSNPLLLAGQAQRQAAALRTAVAEAEQRAAASAAELEAALEAWHDAEAAMIPVANEVDSLRKQYAEAKQKLDQASAALAAITATYQAKQKSGEAIQTAAESLLAAATAVPDDAEIADAKEKLTNKSKLAATELVALEKEVAEKSASVEPLASALEATKPLLQAALQKLEPLEDAVRASEQAMLTVRREATEDEESANALRRKLETAEMIARLPEQEESVRQSRVAVAERESGIAVLETALGEAELKVSAAEQAHQTAQQQLAIAQSDRASAKSELDARAYQAKLIGKAAEAALAASQSLTDDPLLAEIATKLEQRVAMAQTGIGSAATELDKTTTALQAAADIVTAAESKLTGANNQQEVLASKMKTAQENLSAALARVADQQAEFDSALESLSDRWAREFTVSSLKPLTPEQLCWSVFRVTSVYESYWNAEQAELDKSEPLTEEQLQDPIVRRTRQALLEQRTYDKLKNYEATYAKHYGAGAGQPQAEFFSTADQALFTSNGGSINSWVAASGNNVTNRIVQSADSKTAAEELYLGILSRLPTEIETEEVAEHMTGRDEDKPLAAAELVWALLNSAEFRFNH